VTIRELPIMTPTKDEVREALLKLIAIAEGNETATENELNRLEQIIDEVSLDDDPVARDIKRKYND
jgi:hypothetical protein